MSNQKKAYVMLGIGLVAGLVGSAFLPAFVLPFIPAIFAFITIRKNIDKNLGIEEYWQPSEVNDTPVPNEITSAEAPPKLDTDPVWGPVLEYIGVIEEMIISEGQKNNLDDEIMEKTLALLTRITVLIPQLKEINDGTINHNIERLVFKDLNGVINPFVKLSGEAKLKNRRLLLMGLKDINSKLTFYVERIEQKDIIELQTRIDLIHQRYTTVK